MKKIILVVFSIFLIPVLLAGCNGINGADSTEIHNVLDNYEEYFEDQDAESFENIIAEEITVIDNGEENTYDQEEFIGLMQTGFIFIEEVEEFNIKNRDIVINKSTAVVEADIYSKIVIFDEIEESEEDGMFQLKKNNNKWLINLIDESGID